MRIGLVVIHHRVVVFCLSSAALVVCSIHTLRALRLSRPSVIDRSVVQNNTT